MTPGPTPIPESVIRAMSDCQIHHRSNEFKEIFKTASEGLRGIFETRQDCLIIAGSGTATMDATVSNFFSSSDRMLVVRGGKFGERWAEIGEAYGLDVDAIDVEWGRAVDPEIIRTRLKNNSYAGVFFQASETSTGASHSTETIARIVKEEQPETLVVVDGITAVGCMPVRTDAWGLDIVLSGSQKAFMLPPGLAFLTASDRAWDRTKSSDLPKYYLNLSIERKKQQGGQTAWTTPTALVLGLVKALEMMHQEGLDHIQQRHHALSEACRAAAQAVGLGLLAQDAPSRALTAIHCGDGLDAGAIIKGLREDFGIRVAGGQEHLKGRILRIGHLGWVDDGDILRTISAMERVLSNIGHSFDCGAGLQAAEEKLRELSL